MFGYGDYFGSLGEASGTLREVVWCRTAGASTRSGLWQEVGSRWELRGDRRPMERAGILELSRGRRLPGGRRPPAVEREATSFGRPGLVEASVLEEAAGYWEGGDIVEASFGWQGLARTGRRRLI